MKRELHAAGFFFLLLAACLAAPLGAQTTAVRGRVVLASDSTPVAGVRLVLHRVGRAAQGPIDSVTTDPRGRFQFRFPADTTFLYLISASYASIEYFSSPVNTNPAIPDTALVIAVSDTSSTQPVSLAARYLVIRRAAEDGSRGVLDLVILNNRGSKTRISPDSTRPSWIGLLPRGVSGVRVGEADISSETVVTRNDSILVFAPIPPGEKQIALEYAVPPGRPVELLFTQDSVATNILAQDHNARIDGGDMAAVDSQAIEGQVFQRWVGAPHPGDLVTLTFGASGGKIPGWVLPALVGLAGAGLLLSLFRIRPRSPALTLESLTDRIAELEARYEGREGAVPPEEWARYQAERQRLRAELSAHLAARGQAP